MKIYEEFSEFAEALHTFQDCDRPKFFALLACLFALAKSDTTKYHEANAMIKAATRDELEKAIEELRETQGRIKGGERIDEVVEYIRREWIRKEVEA